MKKTVSIILAALVMLCCAVPGFAAEKADWDAYWENDESQSGITVFPGSSETERNFSWYSKSESTPKVTVVNTADGDSREFQGKAVKTNDGDYANKVTVTGLKPGTAYSYTCTSGDYVSDTYSFTTVDGRDFSALYVTDVHISYDEENEYAIRDEAYNYNNVIETALTKSGISLILSAGDQGSQGREDEYKGFSASPAGRGLSTATAMGNHDRKGVAFKYFKNFPNEKTTNINGSYISGDYWFVKGDVLFMVVDSNNGSGLDHHSFMKSAVDANKEVKWRVVLMHHDLYSGRLVNRESENKLLRVLWSSMFSEFAVDLVLTGHSHYYSVSKVIYNNKVAADTGKDAVLKDAAGTVNLVSGSINRPRGDDKDGLGLNDTCGYIYEEQSSKILYNIIDFGEDSIVVKSYSTDASEPFNTLTLSKTSNQGGHPDKLPAIYAPVVNVLGTIYQFFNNISVYNNLKENGYDVSFFDTVLKFSK